MELFTNWQQWHKIKNIKNKMIIQITPFTSGNLTIDSIDLTVNYYNFQGGILIKASFISQNVIINSQNVPLTTDEVNGWGQDDSYMIDLCMSKLNLTALAPTN